MTDSRPTTPTLFVVFGASGDLNKRKIAPALYNLFLEGWMPEQYAIIGTSRTNYSHDAYRQHIAESLNQFSRTGELNKEQWNAFQENLFYVSTDVQEETTFKKLKTEIEKFQKSFGSESQIIYYLAVAPNYFAPIAQLLHKYKLAEPEDHTRIVVEKPFGHDLDSAKHLNEVLKNIFEENQIYRIDHYLGKETVQNIMAFRFANALFEPIWNNKYIEHIQISVSEKLGVQDRGGYYENAGALRDMIQNHLLQLLCLVAMEPPTSFDADEVRNKRLDVMKAIRRFDKNEVRSVAVRGQYAGGWIEGEEVKGYREEKGVNEYSNTETFAALKFFVDTWRWQGVPFYVRTGKRMHQSSSIITIEFKDVPHQIFPSSVNTNWQQNRLIISIQPEMSIRLQVQAKRPGVDLILNPVDMVFDYKGTYDHESPEAYETLILDVMLGDQTLFMRGDQVEAAWELLMPVIETWANKKSISFPNYSSDSWGPEEAEALIAKDGFHWFSLPIKSKGK